MGEIRDDSKVLKDSKRVPGCGSRKVLESLSIQSQMAAVMVGVPVLMQDIIVWWAAPCLLTQQQQHINSCTTVQLIEHECVCVCLCVLTPSCNIALVTAQQSVTNPYVSPCGGITQLPLTHTTLRRKCSERH